MARITGIGGIFLKARDPQALAAWYSQHLGIGLSADYPGKNLLSSDFGSGLQTAMVNYRVDDLDALLDQLRAAHVPIDPKGEDYDYGRFAWITDPEGNRVELWQPLAPPTP